MIPITRRAMVLMAALSGLGSWSLSASAQEPPATLVVVFDGSNSMNARLTGDAAPKHVLVREALRRALPGMAAGTRIGLAGFGHRRTSDCNDAAMITPPSPDPQVVLSELERFRPRGFSPVALALREAAASVAATPGPASLMLVLDDLASCRTEDPCTTATDIAARNPRLAINVLGLGLNPAALERMTCLTNAARGWLVNLQDAREIDAAMKTLFQAAAHVPVSTMRPASAEAPVARTVSAAFQPPVPKGRGLYLSARLSPSGPIVGRPMRWVVTREDDPADAVPVADVDEPAPVIDLPAGAYRVAMQAGPISRQLAVQVADKEPTIATAVLDAGLARLAVRLTKGGTVAAGAIVTAIPVGDDAAARTTLILRAGEDELLLPAGSWRLLAELGLVRAEQAVSLAAGASTDVELSLDAGRLILNAEPVGAGVRFSIAEDDPDSADGRREIARSAAAAPSMLLPAGAYNISARRGTTEVRDRVVLRAGEEVRRRIALGAARVRVASRLPGGADKATVQTRVFRIDGAEREIGSSTELEPLFELNPGRYRIEQRVGAQNVVARREVDVRAESEQRVSLDHTAGTVQLRVAASAGGLQFGEVFWTILDQSGLPVLRTGQPEPLAILAPGRYVAKVDARGARFERTIDVKAGETSRHELGG